MLRLPAAVGGVGGQPCPVRWRGGQQRGGPVPLGAQLVLAHLAQVQRAGLADVDCERLPPSRRATVASRCSMLGG
jgi:hypothetical protein